MQNPLTTLAEAAAAMRELAAAHRLSRDAPIRRLNPGEDRGSVVLTPDQDTEMDAWIDYEVARLGPGTDAEVQRFLTQRAKELYPED